MKKAAIFSMTAFYLLLTTRMFVCTVHCSAESMVNKMGMPMAQNSIHQHHQKKQCTKDKGCDCGKRHVSYTIRENIKAGFDFRFTYSPLTAYQTELPGFVIGFPDINNTSFLTNNNVPPGKSGKNIAIQIHSLQI
jgi:hypothetical protein